MNADARHKLIRQYDVTDASVHDSQKFDGLLNKTNTSAETSPGGRIIRTIGIARAKAKIGLQNLAYVTLERMAAA